VTHVHRTLTVTPSAAAAEDSLGDIWAHVTEAAATEFLSLWFSPNSRSYWVFLVPSLSVAYWLGCRERRGNAALAPHLKVFSSATWFSRSAVNDYGLVILNAMIATTLLAPMAVSRPETTRWVAEAMGDLAGNIGASPAWWAPVLLTAALFLVDDLLRYILHYAEHRVPVLWELHKVHHSAEVMNFITAERHHPLSTLWFQFGTGLGAAVVNGVFLWLFRENLTPVSILGANALWIASNMLCSTLRHSPAWLSFGPSVECWLISPAQHQIHHSVDPRHYDRNFGSTLAIWDRLFGTLYATGPEREVAAFGLGEETARYRSFFALYLVPIAGACRVLLPVQWRARADRRAGA
jgi:sterol desaturase/sphingolipid hydroxylase (fatty acid hydroxylase superfamily)